MQQRRPQNPETHSRSLDHTIKSLQDQIQLTIYNYENILQTQKKNSSDRSQFLLSLIQSLRSKHLEQLQILSSQIQNAEAERESVQVMQQQMENIGQGLDQIMEESQNLKAQNERLTKELDDEETREKELDEEIDSYQRELEECRIKIDEWERQKIKWNRHKKELIEIIEDAEKVIEGQNKSESEIDSSICLETGQDRNTCEHCQKRRIEELRLKYSQEFKLNL